MLKLCHTHVGQVNELIQDHSCYLALGATEESRNAAYQAWFRHQVDEETLTGIREAVNRDIAFGSEKFKFEIEVTLARSMRQGPVGATEKGTEIK